MNNDMKLLENKNQLSWI